MMTLILVLATVACCTLTVVFQQKRIMLFKGVLVEMTERAAILAKLSSISGVPDDVIRAAVAGEFDTLVDETDPDKFLLQVESIMNKN